MQQQQTPWADHWKSVPQNLPFSSTGKSERLVPHSPRPVSPLASANSQSLASPKAFYVSDELAATPAPRPEIGGAGAERGLVFARPGFQHQRQNSMPGPACQGPENATKQENMLENSDSVITPYVVWWIEQEMCRLIRLVEAPERLLPGGSWRGLPYETRYRALALGLARVCQLYAALGGLCKGADPREVLRGAAARVRQRVTEIWAA